MCVCITLTTENHPFISISVVTVNPWGCPEKHCLSVFYIPIVLCVDCLFIYFVLMIRACFFICWPSYYIWHVLSPIYIYIYTYINIYIHTYTYTYIYIVHSIYIIYRVKRSFSPCSTFFYDITLLLSASPHGGRWHGCCGAHTHGCARSRGTRVDATIAGWKWPFIVDLPIKNGDFP